MLRNHAVTRFGRYFIYSLVSVLGCISFVQSINLKAGSLILVKGNSYTYKMPSCKEQWRGVRRKNNTYPKERIILRRQAAGKECKVNVGTSIYKVDMSELIVKAEMELAECVGLSDAAATAQLYEGHRVKDEMVIGPEVLQLRDAAYKENGQLWSLSAQRVTPESYKEDNKRFIKFTCGEYLYTTDQLLGWYQIRGSKRKLLAIVQNEKEHYIVSRWREVALYKTLEKSDNGTEILCAKMKILSSGAIVVEEESERIPIKFQKHITPLENYVTIEPSTDDVILFHENGQLHFTCGGTKPVDGRKYSWYLQGPNPDMVTIPSNQKYDGATNTNTLTLRLSKHDHHQNDLFCAQDYQCKFLPGTRSPPILNYGEQGRSKMIRLIYRGEGIATADPVVTPEKFLDKNNARIQINCYAFLQKTQQLSWYQIKGPDKILLKMIQLENLVYEGGQWMLLSLKKTLMYSDNGSNFYCVKERVMVDGKFSKWPESRRIPITFEREIKALEPPFVTVEPRDTTVYFDVHAIYFNCSGSKPVDGRTYTWFMTDPDSTLTIPLNQTYDVSTNRNSLTLFLNESYHENRLFCSQNYYLYVQHSNGSFVKMYGELKRSHMITLVHWEKVKTQHLIRTIVPPLAFVVLLVIVIVAAAATVRRYRRTAEPSREDEDVYNYVYEGRVTYANLDVRASPAAYATSLVRPEMTNYANMNV